MMLIPVTCPLTSHLHSLLWDAAGAISAIKPHLDPIRALSCECVLFSPLALFLLFIRKYTA